MRITSTATSGISVRFERYFLSGRARGWIRSFLRWRGYDVTTFDIDETFHPDAVGSVHDLSRYEDQTFDVVIASHVLEHMAVPYLDAALAEMARVARFSVVYLPVAGRHAQFRLIPGVSRLRLDLDCGRVQCVSPAGRHHAAVR